MTRYTVALHFPAPVTESTRAMYAYYCQPHSLREVGKAYHMSAATVLRRFQQAGLRLRTQWEWKGRDHAS